MLCTLFYNTQLYMLLYGSTDQYVSKACYAWWTVTVEVDRLNSTACSTGAFIQHLNQLLATSLALLI